MNRMRIALWLLVVAIPGVCRAEPIDPKTAKVGEDGQTLWYDCKDIGVEGRGWAEVAAYYDRLPAKAQGKAPKKDSGMSYMTTGMCVRLVTDAPAIQVRWTLVDLNLAMPHMPATGVSGVDVYARDKAGAWRFVRNGRPSKQTNVASFPLPGGVEYLVYLPLYNGVKSVEIGVAKEHSVSKADAAAVKRRPSIAFYGGSITQGGCASRPGMAYTAIVGRRLDASIINLGFSGSGVMEPEMADLLAELDPTVYVIDALGNMTVEQVRERTGPLVAKIRAAHPGTPILFAEDASVKGISPTEKGRVLQAVLAKLTAEGVKGLHFVANVGMLGDDGEGTVDGVHPSDLGMMRHAEVFGAAIRALLP